MSNLILLRHGQSLWNLSNRFTGEVDIDLSALGKKEARKAGILLKGMHVEIAFTSMLIRAIHTLEIVMEEIGTNIPVIKSPALNERNYGGLQGMNKSDVAKKYGDDKLRLWRRSFETRPPAGESLKILSRRVVPYYLKEIAPYLKIGKNVLIVAHGNSIRALIMFLENLNSREIEKVDLPTGMPRLYQFSGGMKLINAAYLNEQESYERVKLD